MVRRLIRVMMATIVIAIPGAAVPAYADASARTLSVLGEVNSPVQYTAAELAALPQTTATVTVRGRQVTDSGVPLEALIEAAGPAYPTTLANTKNELLRVTATVRGAQGDRVTFAVGELDSAFGNHPALLALTSNGRPVPGGPELVVPGDRPPIRFVPHVTQVTVGIATAPATDTNPAAGSPVEVIDGRRHVTLSAAQLAQLPGDTRTVSFAGPTGVQSHTESGPLLWEVLARAGVAPARNTWVAAVGDDNYVATITPAEQFVGGRPLLLSLAEDGVKLAQPRLVVDGDVKGGRYVSGLVDLYAGTGPAS